MKTKQFFLIIISLLLIPIHSFAGAYQKTRLTAPSLQVSSVSNTQVNLSWVDSNSSCSGFEIMRRLKPTSSFSKIGTTASNMTTFIDSGVVPMSKYYYKVRTYQNGAKKLYSSFSNTISATTPGCGDSIIDAVEQCDDGNNNNLDSCRNNCILPGCGDGIVDAVEQCDDGNTINSDGCENNCTVTISSFYENSPFGFHPALISKLGYPNNGYYDAQNIGVRWNRPSLYALWSKVQPDINDPSYHWEDYDNFFGNIPEGINILANISTQPRGAEDSFGYALPGSYLPVDEDKYRAFVKATVERYDGDGLDDMPALQNPIKYWQVMNEPNPNEKTGYAELQKITYIAIKEACPYCKVLIGGPSAFPDYFKSMFIAYSQYLSDLNGLYVDIFDFHFYGFADGDYRKIKDAYDLIKSKLSEHGFGNIPVWITEMGCHSGNITSGVFGIGINQTEKEQAGDSLKRFVYPLSLGVKKIFQAFGLIEGFNHVDAYFDHTGLIYDSKDSDDQGMGVKKLGYYIYKLMTEKLEGSDWDNIQTVLESDNVYIYKFIKNSKPVYVAWWDYFDETVYYGNSKNVMFPVDFTGEVIITQMIPNADSGAVLSENDYPQFFETVTQPVTNGYITLTLDESPQIIELVVK